MNARSGFEMLVLGTIVKSRQKQEVADTCIRVTSFWLPEEGARLALLFTGIYLTVFTTGLSIEE